MELTNDELLFIYGWVDSFPLSGRKRNITHDFADGRNVAEITKACFPLSIDLRHYTSANSHELREQNWNRLNEKVFRPLGFMVHKDDIQDIIHAEKGAIERVLLFLYSQFSQREDIMA